MSMKTESSASAVPHRRISPIVMSVGALLCVIACAVIITARNFPATAIETDIGAGAFPKFYAVVLIVLAILLVARDWLTNHEATVYHEPSHYVRVAAGVGIVAAYIVLLSFVGYLIATPLFLTVLMLIMQRKRLWLTLLLAITITLILWLLFSIALQVPLPAGSLFE
ncbi:tripartite tricarboxylate transporter TctB family protein [Klebsiella indica]|uniref:Tripartite tricarboxylate transporter TctB family protein n=1 Tax=Klebsiella indica TaxID=2582917 RepID=A0A5R9LF21_9ENTR|nr:tripartite tricarboxylate transporter TctB family protein [Klebsiella indica]TLV12796.1 tripartite tricarboxylate transporter TctB family protein [Klebsiella indica]